LVDEKMSVGHVTRILAEKNHVQLDPKWALVELVPELYMERVYEDNENLVENCLMWKVDSKNTLWFIERPEKFDLFTRPEIYLLGNTIRIDFIFRRDQIK
jgi:amyloid beta A4 precursor protein-binding family B protein 1-interacting protein